MKTFFKLILGVAIFFLFPVTTLFATHPVSLNVQFANHLQLDLPEQDVFIPSKEDLTKVVRVEGEAANNPETLETIVYTTAKETPHDPFKLGENPLGPFDKGRSLGFTLREWLAGSGTGTYTVEGESADLNLTFANLVPSATYTIWCSRITFPPNTKVVDTPCGATDGSENVFKTDTQGNAAFNLALEPLPDSSKETVSLFAIAYHSDGKTYGESPGNFGLNSHVQLAYLIPPPEETPAISPTPSVSSGGLTGSTPKVAILLLVIGAAVWFFWKRSTKKTTSSSENTPEKPEESSS